MKPRFSGFSRNFTHLKEILLFGFSLILYMAMSGHAWPYMAIYGHIWPCLAMHGHIWPCLAMHGHAWPCMAIYGHVWPCMAISTKMAISTNGQNGIAIYMAIYGHDLDLDLLASCRQSGGRRHRPLGLSNRRLSADGHFTSPHAASPHIATGAPHQD